MQFCEEITETVSIQLISLQRTQQENTMPFYGDEDVSARAEEHPGPCL